MSDKEILFVSVDGWLFKIQKVMHFIKNRPVYGRQYYTGFIYQKTNRVQTG